METPVRGEKILILKDHWLHLILLRQKKLEIRGVAYKPGKYYLGHKKLIYGSVQLGEPMPITTVDQFRLLRGLHRIDSAKLPYAKTFGLPVLSVRPSSHRVPFTHPKGAIGIVRYR